MERRKREFHKDFCFSVNKETEKEQYQILLNSLEDKNNRMRAIFAVQKLNEGWDMLLIYQPAGDRVEWTDPAQKTIWLTLHY